MNDKRRTMNVVLHVVGARPNFMKVAPVMQALDACGGIKQVLLHTGQHYDANMSQVFFRQLGLPEPDVNLGVGSGTHAQQTARIMERFEPVVKQSGAELVIVYGDVNSTIATALVCAKLGIRLAHVEAGLRSFDRTMPEEINRILTDRIADILFTPSTDGDENLLKEGVDPNRIRCVGNVMIDTLVRLLPLTEPHALARSAPYVLVTLHRPSTVDDPDTLQDMMSALCDISRQVDVIFPVHPRTRQRIADTNGHHTSETLHLTDPVGYVEFLALQRRARLVITDSGGIQEETTYLGIPCLTARENTERPVTVTLGTNVLIGRDTARLRAEVSRILAGEVKHGQIPELWDGHAGERIAENIEEELGA